MARTAAHCSLFLITGLIFSNLGREGKEKGWREEGVEEGKEEEGGETSRNNIMWNFQTLGSH